MDRPPDSAGVRDLAAWLFEEHGGDWGATDTALRAELSANDRLFRELMEPYAGKVVWDLVRKLGHEKRSGFWNAALRDRSGNDCLHGLHSLARQNLHDYPLQGGKRLGDATIADLDNERAWFAELVRTNGIRMRWFESIIDVMRANGEATPVRDVLSHDDLETMMRESERAVPALATA